MPNSSAYLLVIHGSRDPRPAIALAELAQLFAARIRHPALISLSEVQADSDSIPVGTASLEFHPLPLHQQIVEFCQSHPGIRSLIILPLFLLPGVHVMEDLPQEIALAKLTLGAIEIQTSPHLGAQPKLRRLLNERMSNQPMEAWILLSHGSRRPGANQPIADLADHLGAVPAYWSVSPNLETQIQELSQQGLRQIGILPYFLFPGGITDAIAQSVDTIATQHPHLSLHLTNPLQASSALADLLIDLAQN